MEIRTRAWKRWTTPRYEIFLNEGECSSGWCGDWVAGGLQRKDPPLVLTRRRRKPDRIVRATAKSAVHSMPTRPGRTLGTSKALTTCPVCAVAVRHDRVASHVRRVHGATTGSPVLSSNGSRPTANAGGLDRAIARSASGSAKSAAQPQSHQIDPRVPRPAPAAAAPPAQQARESMPFYLVACPSCQAMVKPSRLERHLRKAHLTKTRALQRRGTVTAISSPFISSAHTFRDHRWTPRFVQGGLPDSSRRRH